MQFEETIKATASELGLSLLASPTRSPDDANTYHVIVNRSAPPSILKALRDSLSNYGISLEVSFYGAASDGFQSALAESLARVFGPNIDSVTVVKSGGVCQIVVLVPSDSESVSEAIKSHVEEVRHLFDDPPVSLKVELDVRKPTAIEFLTIARRKAPVRCETMLVELGRRSFEGLTLEWINHQFDRLRKGNLLHRQHDRTYVLTQAGLAALGSGKGRNSPDVLRLLDLARGEN